MKMPIKGIEVGLRFREKFEGMEELKASIQRHGLIEPIVLDENNVLIAGERRLRAHQDLKLEEIEVRYMKDLADYEKKEIELEENIQRCAFTWQEEVSAKSQIHKLKQSIHGQATQGYEGRGWGLKDTASALGESTATVSTDIALARGLKVFPELMKEKNKSTAMKKLKDKQQQILQEELAKRMKDRGLLEHPSVINGECIAEMKKMDSESIDCIITDPPFGIDVGNAKTYGRMTMTTIRYEDGEYETMDLLDQAFREMYRVLKIDTHAIIFCAIDKFPVVTNLLIKAGFAVHTIPIIWDKGSGSYPSQKTTFVHSYECFLHATKGSRKLNGTPRDVLPIKRIPSNKRIHPSEKPPELIRDLMELVSMPTEKVLDPFAGSGVVIDCARQLSRVGVGIEKDEVYYQAICKRLETTSEK